MWITMLGTVLRSWTTWVLIALLSVIGTLCVINASLRDDYAEQVALHAKATSLVSIKTLEISNLEKSIVNQNAAILRMKADEVELQATVDDAVDQIEEMKSEHEQTMVEIANEVVPQDCQGAMGWLRLKAQEGL